MLRRLHTAGEDFALDKSWGTFFEEMRASDLVQVDRAGLVVDPWSRRTLARPFSQQVQEQQLLGGKYQLLAFFWAFFGDSWWA